MLGVRPSVTVALMIAFMATTAPAVEQPVLIIPESAGAQCVEATSVMRSQHKKLLFAQRDKTVHQGIRSTTHSLTNCVACHANRDAMGHSIPVNGDDQFCESCHRYAGVRMDCFECHATVPDE